MRVLFRSVPAEECSTELHAVVHKGSGKKLGYGALATAAAKQPVPKKEELKLKPRSEWRYIGKDAAGFELEGLWSGEGGDGGGKRVGGRVEGRGVGPPGVGGTGEGRGGKKGVG